MSTRSLSIFTHGDDVKKKKKGQNRNFGHIIINTIKKIQSLINRETGLALNHTDFRVRTHKYMKLRKS